LLRLVSYADAVDAELDPDRLEEEIRIKKNELALIVDHIKVNNDILEKSNSNLQSELAKSKFTQRTLNKLSDLFKALDLYDLDLSELLQLPRVMVEFKKLGWNAKTIVAKYEQEVDLEGCIKKQESKMQRYEAVLEDLYRKNTEEKRKWGSYLNALKISNKLVESGVSQRKSSKYRIYFKIILHQILPLKLLKILKNMEALQRQGQE
jgi:hypothetical protein